MSLLTGPGRNSEMSVMRSSKVSGANLPTSSRWPGDSIWNMPRVRVDWISANVVGVVERHLGLVVEVDRVSARRRPGATSSIACAIADCIRMPRTSSLSRPSSSTSSLSNWLIGKPSQLASTGVRSSSVASESSTPHGCSATCRGSPSSRATRPEQQVELRPLAEPRGPQLGQLAQRIAHVAGPDVRERLGDRSISPGGMPSAAPTSRIACRTR